MGAALDLSRFWERLETNFPLAGPRSELRGHIGEHVVTALEGSGLLAYVRIADVVACPHPGGAGCPRQVIGLRDGTVQGVCGNDPPECADIVLAREDVEVLGVDPEGLCHALHRPLRFGGRVEPIADLPHTYLVGTFKPEPAIRHTIYLVARCGDREYAEALDALRSRHDGASFAVLVPTDRFVGTDTIRQMATLGIPIIVLDGTVNADDRGRLVTGADVRRLFDGVGRRAAATPALTHPVVAHVLTPDGWQDLDESGYGRLVETAAEYEILADERALAVWKRVDGTTRPQPSAGIQASFFRMIRRAVEKPGSFDPAVEGPDEDQVSGKQIFQRARRAIDIKYTGSDGTTTWRLFKTARVDDHAVYHFQPDPDCTFALIFLPSS